MEFTSKASRESSPSLSMKLAKAISAVSFHPPEKQKSYVTLLLSYHTCIVNSPSLSLSLSIFIVNIHKGSTRGVPSCEGPETRVNNSRFLPTVLL